MAERVRSDWYVGMLLRRANDAGGMAMVRKRGDSHDGSLLIITYEKSIFSGIYQRERDLDGQSVLSRIGPADDADAEHIEGYWQKRAKVDPDLWVIELDIAAAERFAAETFLID